MHNLRLLRYVAGCGPDHDQRMGDRNKSRVQLAYARLGKIPQLLFFEIKALNEDYWVMIRPLIEARKEMQDEVIMYVMNNTYNPGAHIHPEVEAFLKNEFNPVTTAEE